MSAKYDYDDIVTLSPCAGISSRVGEKCWIVGVFEKRPKGDYMDKFPDGVVYTVEFEDGNSVEVHEDNLLLFEE